MVHTFNTKDQNIFFTSDTHFWHTKIMQFCSRPFSSIEEMNETIIENWNRVVGKNDIVFHLGDFAFCGTTKIYEILNRLNGKIYLCIGNHDWKNLRSDLITNFVSDEKQKRFTYVAQQYAIIIDEQYIYLNHFPYLCYAGSYGNIDADGNYKPTSWQLFGHVHSGPNSQSGLDCKRLTNLFPSQYDVGVDNNSFTPISFAEVKKIITDQIYSQNLYRGTK